MTLEPFCTDDITPFLELAAAEGWVAERWEFEFHLAEFSRGCIAARDDNGETAGFVTSLLHLQSGWIGNLIVAEHFRGRGIGGALFSKALEALRSAGAQTIWLTASKSGAPLYEKHGFAGIDTIVRWAGTGRRRYAEHDCPGDRNDSNNTVIGIDCQAWGDRRDSLLAATIGRGRLMLDETGFAAVQPCGDALQFGPFAALDALSAERLFESALRSIPFGSRFYLDSPASNRAALRMFNRRRLRISGTTRLMYAGSRPDYRPELIYGLATMGSCG
jgi:ribosomal protein S18 acetylase RimI-like enzyme